MATQVVIARTRVRLTPRVPRPMRSTTPRPATKMSNPNPALPAYPAPACPSKSHRASDSGPASTNVAGIAKTKPRAASDSRPRLLSCRNRCRLHRRSYAFAAKVTCARAGRVPHSRRAWRSSSRSSRSGLRRGRRRRRCCRACPAASRVPLAPHCPEALERRDQCVPECGQDHEHELELPRPTGFSQDHHAPQQRGGRGGHPRPGTTVRSTLGEEATRRDVVTISAASSQTPTTPAVFQNA